MKRVRKWRSCCLEVAAARPARQAGFTLLEILVALAISSFVITAVYAVYMDQLHAANAQEKIVAMRQNWRAGHYVIGRELMKAGYSSDIVSKFHPGFTRATKSALTFTYVEDGTGDLISVSFDLVDSGGVKRIERTVSGVAAPVAEEIEALEFIYILKNGSSTWTPGATDLDDIRSVRVSIVARTENAVNGYPTANTFSLRFPDGQTENTLSFASDGVYRQMVTGLFNCRNMKGN